MALIVEVKERQVLGKDRLKRVYKCFREMTRVSDYRPVEYGVWDRSLISYSCAE